MRTWGLRAVVWAGLETRHVLAAFRALPVKVPGAGTFNPRRDFEYFVVLSGSTLFFNQGRTTAWTSVGRCWLSLLFLN